MCSAVMAPSPRPSFIFCSPCLPSFSIQLSHSLAPRLSALCLQAAADSGNYPSTRLLPGQFSCEPLVSAALEMKEGWKDALGVWDQREAAACFSFDLDTVQVFFFHLSCFFPSLYLCTVGNVWDRLRFYSISSLLSLVWSLSALFLLLPAAVVPHLIFQVVIMWKFLLSFSPDLLLNLSTSFVFFNFRTPTSALHHLRPTFPGCSLPMIGLVGFFFLSFCLHPSILSSFMSSWAVMVFCWSGWVVKAWEKGRSEAVKPVILSSLLSGMCGEWREIWSPGHTVISPPAFASVIRGGAASLFGDMWTTYTPAHQQQLPQVATSSSRCCYPAGTVATDLLMYPQHISSHLGDTVLWTGHLRSPLATVPLDRGPLGTVKWHKLARPPEEEERKQTGAPCCSQPRMWV